MGIQGHTQMELAVERFTGAQACERQKVAGAGWDTRASDGHALTTLRGDVE